MSQARSSALMRLITDCYREGLLELRDGQPGSGLRLLGDPIDYWRVPVWPILLSRCRPGMRVLDIGSPKIFAYALASQLDVQIDATDLHDRDLFDLWAVRWARRHPDSTRLGFRFADARALPYADATFDLVFSISVLEHIPGDGDRQALAEIRRVLRPDGCAVIEIPYGPRYAETFAPHHIMNETGGAAVSFYERRYDDASLRARLLALAGLPLEQQIYVAERLHGLHEHTIDSAQRSGAPSIERWPRVLPHLRKCLGWPLALLNLSEVPASARARASSLTLVYRRDRDLPHPVAVEHTSNQKYIPDQG